MINEIASVFTAGGVMIAAWQLVLSHRQSRTNFEDSLAHEYRKLAASLPTEALLGESLGEWTQLDSLDEFYHYFDLTNGQIFLRQLGRVSKRTWKFWCDGIQTNLSRPAFAKAWLDISVRAGSDFSELRRLIAEDYKSDPRTWR